MVILALPDRRFYQFIRILGYFASMDEHRAIPRNRVLKAETIEFGGGAINCMVRNLSIKGLLQTPFLAMEEGVHIHYEATWPVVFLPPDQTDDAVFLENFKQDSDRL
jgi:hypothetical protein